MIASRRALTVAVCMLVAYLALKAAFSGVPSVWWFGRPGDQRTTLVVLALLAALCVLSYRAQTRERPGAIPGGVIAILATSSAVLALSSYIRCWDIKHFPLFTALIWTIGTVRGNSSEYSLRNGPCPAITPAALEIARTAGQFVLYVSVITILVSLLTTEIDRARIGYARYLVTLSMSAGDLLLIDNYRAVHGRGAFRPRYDGTDRWLRKITVVRDLRRTGRRATNEDARALTPFAWAPVTSAAADADSPQR